MGAFKEWITDWISECCETDPLYELNIKEGENPLGLCRQCQDHATFKQLKK
jgi:hypothetical protein